MSKAGTVAMVTAAALAAAGFAFPVLAQPSGLTPPASNNACLQSAGQWTVTGTIARSSVFMGYFSVDFAELVAGTPVVPVDLRGEECLIGWAAGEGLPGTCFAGHLVTVTGPLSFEGGIAGVQVRQVECSLLPAEPAVQGLPFGNPI